MNLHTRASGVQVLDSGVARHPLRDSTRERGAGFYGQGVHSVDVIHVAATVTIALLVIRALQAIAEHYFPDSEGVAAARFIYGGP